MEELDRFTERARTAVQFAREEALQLHHDYVGVEHLLLGLLRVGDGIAARVLRTLGVDLRKARIAVTHAVGRGLGPVLGVVELTSGVKNAMAHAIEESLHAGQQYIGTEHLLLGVILVPGHYTRQVLDSLGVTADKARAVISDIYRRFEDATTVGSNAPSVAPRRDPLELLNQQAQNAVTFANDEAHHLRHDHIGVVHLLLGLIREESGVASRILQDAGLRYPEVRAEVSFIVGPGESAIPDRLDLSPRAQAVMQFADRECLRQNAPAIDTGHLLVGIVRAGDSIATGVCDVLGVRLSRIVPTTMQSDDPVTAEPDATGTEAETAAAPPPPDDSSGPTHYHDQA